MKMKSCAALLVSILFFSAVIFTGCPLEIGNQLEPKLIVQPHISMQPASASYYTNDKISDLRAQVWGWNPEDGALSYQWYTFTDEGMADFITNGKGEPIPEEIALEVSESDGIEVINIPLSLSDIQPSTSAGRKYYYYLEITNEDKYATNSKEAVVRSEIATISFSSPGSPKVPRINRQPINASYQFGRNLVMEELSVKAAADDSGELSYQWYHNTTGIINDIVIIPGADSSAYGPTLDILTTGRNYFFVEIINRIGTRTADILSIPAIITMNAGNTALEPIFLKQPDDALYFTGNTIEPLFLEVEDAIDGGKVSVQWYSNTTQSARNGTIINGATQNRYLPNIRNAGTFYYYAVATNTNPSVKSNVKTAVTNSRAVKVVMTTPGTSADVSVTVTVADPRTASNRFQYVRGFGGMDVAWSNFPEQTPADMELMYNPDWGFGYNINRIMIPPQNTNINVTIKDLVNSHRPYYYENAKIVNKYGGYNAAAPWSPPKEWKSNNSINGGGNLVHSYYKQYADYLRAYAKHMFDAGVPIYAVSIQNEPNYAAGYDGCEWTPEEMRDFFREVGRFTRGIRGWGGGREIPNVLTMNGESANTPRINLPALLNPVSRASIDFYSRHVYGSPDVTLWRVNTNGSDGGWAHGEDTARIENILRKPDGTFYEVWMTEHNINSASAPGYPNDSTWNYVWRFMNDVDLVMRLNNENAFVWWASKRFYSMVGDGQYGTRDGAPLPRGYGLSHYAKYTIDTHRVNLDISGSISGTPINHTNRTNSHINNTVFNLDNNTPRITAYAHLISGSDNQPVISSAANWSDVSYISLIMMTPTNTDGTGGRNLGKIEIKMPAGFVIGGASAHISTSAANMFAVETVEVSENRDSAFVTLGPGQLLSVRLTRQQ